MSTFYNPNAPLGSYDAQGNLSQSSFADTAFRAEYSGVNMIYSGEARPGALEGASVWKIRKLEYDGSGNLTSITWPQNGFGKASAKYEFEWDQRATYTYS